MYQGDRVLFKKAREKLDRGYDVALFLDKVGEMRLINIVRKGCSFEDSRRTDVSNYSVIDEEGEQLGMMVLARNTARKRVFIELLKTDPSHRGFGFATALLNILEVSLAKDPYEIVYGDYCPLYTWKLEHPNTENKEAKEKQKAATAAFYNKNGYKIIKHSDYIRNKEEYPKCFGQLFVKSSKDSSIVFKELNKNNDTYETFEVGEDQKLYIEKRLYKKYSREEVLSGVGINQEMKKGI